MGIHEWLLKRGNRYEVTEELHEWLAVWREESEKAANEHCDRFFINRPIAYRAIAPTGTLGLIAGTTTGIEPLYAAAYKRRYLVDGTRWHYQFAIDSTAEILIKHGIAPENITDTANDLANDFERRIKFQADIQDYVDQAISSTINLPKWGTEKNNETRVKKFAKTLAKYAPRLRGFTAYPDCARGGQPITAVPYEDAVKKVGVIYEENEDVSCKGGVCGI
jgi:ribonucleoside-diphosphate reductase alpha chain